MIESVTGILRRAYVKMRLSRAARRLGLGPKADLASYAIRVGDRVHYSPYFKELMSPVLHEIAPKRLAREGTIVGLTWRGRNRNHAARVLWDGRKSSEQHLLAFLEKV